MVALENYVKEQKDIALVSENLPLLRDLNAIENIALILEYHQNKSVKNAEKIVSKLFKKAGLESVKNKKIYEMDKKDTIILKYLRAYISDFKTILVLKPFSMLDKMEDMDALFEQFRLFDSKEIIVADLKSNTYYKEINVIQ